MANPTTNYSFAMPTNTDLVKDLPADFDIFGQAVDDRIKALNPETTAGDISYRGSTANAKTRLALGTAGQVLKVNSGATAPEWGSVSASPTNASATVATSETTTSGSYTDLTTSGPAVTLTTGTKALVLITAQMTNTGGAATESYVSYAVSGATTIAASDTVAVISAVNASGQMRMCSASRPTLTAGSNTFTMKYQVESGTGTFSNREIIVIDLGS